MTISNCLSPPAAGLLHPPYVQKQEIPPHDIFYSSTNSFRTVFQPSPFRVPTHYEGKRFPAP